MKVNFVESVHCFTDQISDPDVYNRVIGFYSDNYDQYYNLDEVKVLYDRGEASNVYEHDDKLCLHEQWLTYCCPITISFGLVANEVDDRFQSCLDYCYDHHICYHHPVSVSMMCGMKVLETDSQGRRVIRYSVSDQVYHEMDKGDQDWFHKIALGKMNKLRYDPAIIHDNGNIRKEYTLECEDVEVYSRDVIITGVSDKTFQSRAFITAIQELDLQVWMNRYHRVNFHQLFHATCLEQANRGQFHKLKHMNERDSDIYWFNHPYEHEIK